MENVKVGQKVYGEPIGNMARRSNSIREFTVSKVGRKYFEVEELYRSRFFVGTGFEDTDFNANYRMYATREEIELKNEAAALIQRIRKYFGSTVNAPSLEQLKQIAAIIGI